MIFDDQSGTLIEAVPRPGKRPFGDEDAMVVHRVPLMGLIDRMPDIGNESFLVPVYRKGVLRSGSCAIAMLALAWLTERGLDIKLLA